MYLSKKHKEDLNINPMQPSKLLCFLYDPTIPISEHQCIAWQWGTKDFFLDTVKDILSEDLYPLSSILFCVHSTSINKMASYSTLGQSGVWSPKHNKNNNEASSVELIESIQQPLNLAKKDLSIKLTDSVEIQNSVTKCVPMNQEVSGPKQDQVVITKGSLSLFEGANPVPAFAIVSDKKYLSTKLPDFLELRGSINIEQFYNIDDYKFNFSAYGNTFNGFIDYISQKLVNDIPISSQDVYKQERSISVLTKEYQTKFKFTFKAPPLKKDDEIEKKDLRTDDNSNIMNLFNMLGNWILSKEEWLEVVKKHIAENAVSFGVFQFKSSFYDLAWLGSKNNVNEINEDNHHVDLAQYFNEHLHEPEAQLSY